MSSHIATALGAVIATTLVIAQLQSEVNKDYAAAGYIVIDKVGYKLVPMEKTR